ncbi:MAG: hypothetical protein QW424_06730, partial [Candidatus Bathyarchaeia archaeon]
MLSARELSIGITKLSGSNPFLKVRIEIRYDMRNINGTAIMLTIIRIDENWIKYCGVSRAFNANDITERAAKIISEDNHDPIICSLSFLKSLKDGLI